MLSKRKILLAGFAFLFLTTIVRANGVGVLALVESTHAAGDALDPFFKTLDQALSWVAIAAHFFIYILSAICGLLLDPGFISLKTDAQSMGSTLLKLWQISRNITNILLAFMLVIGAVMTVIFADNSFQKYAVKFVLAVILVNFSWFFPRVVLDLSNILTATIYALPSSINVPCTTFDTKGQSQNCKVIADFAFFKADIDENVWKCPVDFGGKEKIVCVREEDLESGANTPNAIFGGLIYNHARFQYFTKVEAQGGGNPLAGPNTAARLPQLLTFTLLMTIMLFFSIALLFPLLALTLVLLIRIPVIWITVAFMPFMFLGFVAGDQMKIFNPMEIWNKFLHAAFIPVVTAIPFSIGFIMVNVGLTNQPAGWDLATHPFMRQFTRQIVPGVSNLWQLLWVGMTIAIVWLGARTAFKMDALFEKFASPIMNAGASIGRLLVKLPLLMPLPLPGGATPLGIARVAQNAEQAFIDPLGKFRMPEVFGGGVGPVGLAASKITNHVTANIQQTINNEITRFNSAADGAPGQNIRDDAIRKIRVELEKAATQAGVTIDLTNKQNLVEVLRKVTDKVPGGVKLDETKLK
ncbi:hypothetical protein AUJ46_00820 [Candidatus Peregrinibacteria bacterium CG1_02_54_53]|nr:MAG: hypothetical protein AUJ46_00820 [Candidatus Peregrinibacteria bacterium CG1_02_54_53]PIR50109.1 MAG: hypothetical protein COU79_01240 [Candidatus Peregrinibacteria bacterium CG10_big_fil_rev_8_21_14_0_10_54_7]